MTTRLDFLTKWYLRLIAIVWLSFVPLLYLITFLAGNENISFAIFLSSLFEWAILLPFGFEQTIPVEFVPLIRFFFCVLDKIFFILNSSSCGSNGFGK